MNKKYFYVIFLIVSFSKAMENKLEEKIGDALSRYDLKQIKNFCQNKEIDFNHQYVHSNATLFFTLSPFEFALQSNSFELASMLCKFGAKPTENDFQTLYSWGAYRVIPIMRKYFNVNNSKNINLLHLAVDTVKDEAVHKLIAMTILFFGKKLCNEKKLVDEVELTPLLYAESGLSMDRISAQKAAEILSNEELLYKTIEEVKHKNQLDTIKDFGMYEHCKFREIGMNNTQMKELKYFNYTKQTQKKSLLSNSKKEE